MEWIQLTTLESAKELAKQQLLVIFKHNPTCSISKGVQGRLQERQLSVEQLPSGYWLDIIDQKGLSMEIAGWLGVPHQSPQLLLVNGTQCTAHQWGYDIDLESLLATAKSG